MNHVEERFGTDTNKELLLMCIGISSCLGRLIFGVVADYVDGVNKVYLQVRELAPPTRECSAPASLRTKKERKNLRLCRCVYSSSCVFCTTRTHMSLFHSWEGEEQQMTSYWSLHSVTLHSIR